MTGVELPDYSWLWDFVFLAMTVGGLACAITPALIKGRFSKILNHFTRQDEKRARDNMEERLKNKFKGFPKKVYKEARISKKPAVWNLRPHLKEDAHVCGFTKPGEWQCRCGQRKCETFGNLCEAVGWVDATPPVECGYIRAGEWQCNCGKTKCEDFRKFCEAMGGSDATPPVEPMPDRKAAIAHTKAKS